MSRAESAAARAACSAGEGRHGSSTGHLAILQRAKNPEPWQQGRTAGRRSGNVCSDVCRNPEKARHRILLERYIIGGRRDRTAAQGHVAAQARRRGRGTFIRDVPSACVLDTTGILREPARGRREGVRIQPAECAAPQFRHPAGQSPRSPSAAVDGQLRSPAASTSAASTVGLARVAPPWRRRHGGRLRDTRVRIEGPGRGAIRRSVQGHLAASAPSRRRAPPAKRANTMAPSRPSPPANAR